MISWSMVDVAPEVPGTSNMDLVSLPFLFSSSPRSLDKLYQENEPKIACSNTVLRKCADSTTDVLVQPSNFSEI